MDDLRVDLPLEFDFLFSPTYVEVISGKQEGIYSWIAVNYVLGKFDHNISGGIELTSKPLYQETLPPQILRLWL